MHEFMVRQHPQIITTIGEIAKLWAFKGQKETLKGQSYIIDDDR